jgi:hypothetical protein
MATPRITWTNTVSSATAVNHHSAWERSGFHQFKLQGPDAASVLITTNRAQVRWISSSTVAG